MGILHSIKDRVANRIILVDILAALFGMGAWLAVNGLYTQLPLLVPSAPEGWNLSSYIVIIIQAANIGLILYDVVQRFWKEKVPDSILIYILMVIGSLSLLLLGFYYSSLTVIGGSPHSLALFILVFGCALIACTSSVLFIPYMNRFRETYLVSYMIGEGVGAFLPSILSLIQGVGGNPVCRAVNASDPHTKYELYTPPARFNVTIFLSIISCLQVVSLAAFFLLKSLPVCSKERVAYASSRTLQSKKNNNDNTTLSPEVGLEPSPKARTEISVDGHHEQAHNGITESRSSDGSSPPPKRLDSRTFMSLLFIQILLSTLANGLFPSIQTYSCLPYGNVAYHLAINLGSISNPLACYLLFFITFTSLPIISLLFSLGFAVAVYIFVASVMSPTPPLVGTHGGEALTVISWILFTGLVSYVKLAIATRLRKDGGAKGLFWYGVMTQIGAATGAVIGFVLLNYTSIFTSYTPTC